MAFNNQPPCKRKKMEANHHQTNGQNESRHFENDDGFDDFSFNQDDDELLSQSCDLFEQRQRNERAQQLINTENGIQMNAQDNTQANLNDESELALIGRIEILESNLKRSNAECDKERAEKLEIQRQFEEYKKNQEQQNQRTFLELKLEHNQFLKLQDECDVIKKGTQVKLNSINEVMERNFNASKMSKTKKDEFFSDERSSDCGNSKSINSTFKVPSKKSPPKTSSIASSKVSAKMSSRVSSIASTKSNDEFDNDNDIIPSSPPNEPFEVPPTQEEQLIKNPLEKKGEELAKEYNEILFKEDGHFKMYYNNNISVEELRDFNVKLRHCKIQSV